MTIQPLTSSQLEVGKVGLPPLRRVLARVKSSRLVREVLVFLTFCLFTAILTWPYVTRLRDAVVDPGDPYLISWILWWDYHQSLLITHHSPLFCSHPAIP